LPPPLLGVLALALRGEGEQGDYRLAYPATQVQRSGRLPRLVLRSMQERQAEAARREPVGEGQVGRLLAHSVGG
jgi:hypothetical protein